MKTIVSSNERAGALVRDRLQGMPPWIQNAAIPCLADVMEREWFIKNDAAHVDRIAILWLTAFVTGFGFGVGEAKKENTDLQEESVANAV